MILKGLDGLSKTEQEIQLPAKMTEMIAMPLKLLAAPILEYFLKYESHIIMRTDRLLQQEAVNLRKNSMQCELSAQNYQLPVFLTKQLEHELTQPSTYHAILKVVCSHCIIAAFWYFGYLGIKGIVAFLQ